MLVLDTDHLTHIDSGSEAGAALKQLLEASHDEPATTIVSVEEQLRGWLSQIKSAKSAHQLIEPYRRRQVRIRFFAGWQVLPFDGAAATQLERLRLLRLRIGTMDLRIASIALAYGATLLSRNLADFQRVPELSVEDWL